MKKLKTSFKFMNMTISTVDILPTESKSSIVSNTLVKTVILTGKLYCIYK